MNAQMHSNKKDVYLKNGSFCLLEQLLSIEYQYLHCYFRFDKVLHLELFYI